MSLLGCEPLRALVATVSAALICCVLLYARFTRASDLPPGPRPLPFIGNIHQVPIDDAERTYAKWSSQYGDIIFLKLFTRPTLIVNSTAAARELLEKRSAKYSDRPPFGWGDIIGTQRMGERLRKHRRWIHSTFFARGALDQLTQAQSREIRTLLRGLVYKPEQYVAHLHRFTSSIVLEALYGHAITSDDDEYLTYAERALKGTTEVTTPGAAIVDFIPFLRHVPAWFPGADFKRQAAKTKAAVQLAHTKPYELVERLMASGDEKPSLVRSLIEQCTAKGTLAEERYDIMNVGAITYVGTQTQSVLLNFMLAAVLHPEAYVKAQEEIDRVVGNDRLPDLSDRNSLPYLECMLREVYRWNAPVPLGIPHALSEEDTYRGYRLPKDCMILTNLWCMTQNAELYPDPETFRPERFWGLSEEDLEELCPSNIVFGYGRRICPGRRFADRSIWLSMAAMIATLDIQKARDASGGEITPPMSFTSGSVSHAKEFVCSIKPRAAAAGLIASFATSTTAFT
ncbi:cytochrome P450 monooxygenase [Fomitopsis serialis]|uniref:cytochrome P450 monooxygenase n=1 Tax=Fomitopsis serialis TaxID=139415 RepID=UPI002007348E|nr:cytochrome P450 monooxygenase [Neoantrodia serialis]KAH9917083.1 cytochrome P450 monooxygenase [Neoantrodia serialis]